MGNALKAILGIIVGLFVISGVFRIIGALFNFTFGVLGAALSLVWRIIFNPVTLIIAIAIAAYLIWRKRQGV